MVREAFATLIGSLAGAIDSLRLNFLAGLWFLAWLIGGIGEQVNKAAVAVEADNTVEVMTAIGVGGLYLLIAGGIISLMGSLISGPNPLAVALNKALDKLKGAE